MSEPVPWKNPVPGILLKTNLFGDGQRKNDQDCSDDDGELSVRVPGTAGVAVSVMSHGSDH